MNEHYQAALAALNEALHHVDAVEDHCLAAYIAQTIDTVKARLAAL